MPTAADRSCSPPAIARLLSRPRRPGARLNPPTPSPAAQGFRGDTAEGGGRFEGRGVRQRRGPAGTGSQRSRYSNRPPPHRQTCRRRESDRTSGDGGLLRLRLEACTRRGKSLRRLLRKSDKNGSLAVAPSEGTQEAVAARAATDPPGGTGPASYNSVGRPNRTRAARAPRYG